MPRRKSEGFDLGGFLFALIIELPLTIWIGTQRPLWQEPPLVMALWVGGFVLLFFVIYKLASRREALTDFLATGRKVTHRKYPKERSSAANVGSDVSSGSPPVKR
jgi:hypothetical protein